MNDQKLQAASIYMYFQRHDPYLESYTLCLNNFTRHVLHNMTFLPFTVTIMSDYLMFMEIDIEQNWLGIIFHS